MSHTQTLAATGLGPLVGARHPAQRQWVIPQLCQLRFAAAPGPGGRQQGSLAVVRSRGPLAPRSSVRPDGTFDVDNLDVDSLQLDDPFGIVGDVMTTGALRCATPDQPLSSAASKLDKVTGLAVVDDNDIVVGVVSIKVR